MKVKVTLILDIDDSDGPISSAEIDETVANLDVTSDVIQFKEVTVESYTVIDS